MKKPHARLVDARIRVAQLKRQLAEAQAEESAAEHAAAEAERAERADTVRPPPPDHAFTRTVEHDQCPGPTFEGHCMCGWAL